MSKHICPNCQADFEHSVFAARLAGPIICYLLTSKNPRISVALSMASYVIGGQIDKYIAANITPKCPACGYVLQLAVREVETRVFQTL